MSQASVLYDVPGPKAILRNRIIGVFVILAVLAFFAFVIYRFAATGQFEARKWEPFTLLTVWQTIGVRLLGTLGAFTVAAVGALVLGFALAIGRLSDRAWIRLPVTAVTEVFRAIPVLILMMLLYYGLPTLGMRMTPFEAVVISLIVYNGAVLAEVIRAGVESLPRGQGEAGYAIGMTKAKVLSLIQMPQAVRAMMPVIISQLVVTLKDTALGFIITYKELLDYAKLLGNSPQFGIPIVPTTIVVGLVYIALCAVLSWVANYVQKRNAGDYRRAKKAQYRPDNPGGVTDTQLLAAQDLPAELEAELRAAEASAKSATDTDGGQPPR